MNAKTGVDARAQIIDDEFTVLKGSTVVGVWAGEGRKPSTIRAYAGLRALHGRLVADGSIVVEGALGRVTRDIPFRSPSSAGAVALGRSCNGRQEWTWADGTYADWEERDLGV